ncbi:secreted protein [Rhodopirellula maiorica SM1]|uniref:Secreted protein n=2 Tax=Novipirellula TaxID=2795426 RepID=M5RLM3_9BACT|nr:secreted protein [Rhodopirellula maiorica SM1]
MHPPRKTRRRSGSALLLCTLAAAVLSMSAIAMLRSSKLAIARVDARRSAIQGRHIGDGLVQQAIAQLKSDANFEGEILATGTTLPTARVVVKRPSKEEAMLYVFLYEKSVYAAKEVSIDVKELTTKGKTTQPKTPKTKSK